MGTDNKETSNDSLVTMRENMEKAGYSEEDINEVINLEKEYLEECEEISQKCEEEGYPGQVANYDLRCGEARKYYDEQIAFIDAKYDLNQSDALFSESSSEDLAEFETEPEYTGDAYEKTEDSCSDEVKDEGQDQTSSLEEHQVDDHNIGDDDMDNLL